MGNYKPDRELPAHVTIPNFNGYQVRIVRNREEHSASFAWNEHGGPEKALQAAVAWRDQMLANLPRARNGVGGFRAGPSRNKQSWHRVGITRYFRVDNRKPNKPEYLTFGVNFVGDNGKKRTKSFQVGRADLITEATERHAAKTAEAFRADYEFWRAKGLPFDPSKYDDWKTCEHYPFEPPEIECKSSALRSIGRSRDKGAMRYISRMRDKLWRVWVTFGEDDFGQHYFGDTAHGSMGAALRAAMEFRDQLLLQHNLPLREYNGNGWFSKHRKNKSGEVGIGLTRKPAQMPCYVAWTVRNMIGGKQKNQSWSIRKHGYIGAWKAAVEARAKHTGCPTTTEPPPPPDWLMAWARNRGINLLAKPRRKKTP